MLRKQAAVGLQRRHLLQKRSWLALRMWRMTLSWPDTLIAFQTWVVLPFLDIRGILESPPLLPMWYLQSLITLDTNQWMNNWKSTKQFIPVSLLVWGKWVVWWLLHTWPWPTGLPAWQLLGREGFIHQWACKQPPCRGWLQPLTLRDRDDALRAACWFSKLSALLALT